MFIGIIRDKYIDRCLALDLMNTTNYVNIWILSLWSIVICKEVCHMCLNKDPLILIGTTSLCQGGILSVDLTVTIVVL